MEEKPKSVQLDYEGKVLLNKAKSKILSDNPNLDLITDKKTIKIALKHFVDGG